MRGPEIIARNQRMKANMEREGLPFNAERNMSYNSRLAQELSEMGRRPKAKATKSPTLCFAPTSSM